MLARYVTIQTRVDGEVGGDGLVRVRILTLSTRSVVDATQETLAA